VSVRARSLSPALGSPPGTCSAPTDTRCHPFRDWRRHPYSPQHHPPRRIPEPRPHCDCQRGRSWQWEATGFFIRVDGASATLSLRSSSAFSSALLRARGSSLFTIVQHCQVSLLCASCSTSAGACAFCYDDNWLNTAIACLCGWKTVLSLIQLSLCRWGFWSDSYRLCLRHGPASPSNV
jgi:hypothetical protein